jgi:hypothetical protein
MSDRYSSATPLELVRGSLGVDYVSEPTDLPDGFATRMTNLSFIRGTLRSRPAARLVQPTAPVPNIPLIAVYEFVKSDGTRYLVRFVQTGVQVLDQNEVTWSNVAGVTTTASFSYPISVVGWGDNLLFTNGYDGIYEIDPAALTGRRLDGAVVGHQLAVFAGRVISVRSDRISWSVRNDNTDWDGVGSGYEDLRSTPDGYIGGMLSLFPVTDDTALLLRGDSVWLVSQTGIAEAPFRFNRLFASQSLVSPFAACAVPGGVVGLFTDGFHFVTPGEIRPVGEQIARHVLDNLRDPRSISCAYDKVFRRIGFLVKELSDTVLWVMHLDRYKWTRYEYPFVPVHVSTVHYRKSILNVDDLIGNVDDLVGPVDELGTTSMQSGFVLCDQEFVYREDQESTTDSIGFADATSQIELRSGLIYAEDPDQRAKIIGARLMYRSADTRTLYWYVSSDAGQTWMLWSTSVLQPTAYNRIAYMSRPFAAEQVMVKCTTDGLGDIKLLSLSLKVDPGARRKS